MLVLLESPLLFLLIWEPFWYNAGALLVSSLTVPSLDFPGFLGGSARMLKITREKRIDYIITIRQS